MRVVSGIWSGRRIPVPAETDLRPTADRAREAIFNMAYGLGLPQDAIVVDAFCGTGALGIEALSRGAAHVTFIDNDAQACSSVQQTLESFEADPATYRIVCGCALETLPPLLATPATTDPTTTPAATPADLLLVDPPYNTDHWAALLQLGLLQLGQPQPAPGVFIAEADRFIEIPADSHWEQYRRRRYGRAHITILRHRLRYRQPRE